MVGLTRQRIEIIRPWLTAERRQAIETAFGPSLSGSLIAPAASAVKIVRLWASVRDGAGVSTLLASLKRGSRYEIVSIMIKPEGVADAVCREDLSRADAQMMELMLKSAAPSNQIRIGAFARILRLALGRNLASKAPPPFSLVGALETLPLGPLTPDLASTTEIIQTLLAEVADGDHPAKIARAHQDLAGSELVDGWFEAGELVDKLLEPARSKSKAASILLKSYLPTRRQFWAAQCAHSALALSDGDLSVSAIWRQLALVARDIASDKPLEAIPLMRQIAQRSAEAYFLAD